MWLPLKALLFLLSPFLAEGTTEVGGKVKTSYLKLYTDQASYDDVRANYNSEN